jgi:LDH2 family malate/lactate/ureidoglycolate dehydrogenase
MVKNDYYLVDSVDLQAFTISVFQKLGFSSEHAKDASEVLLAADLRGIDSHGSARLTGYVRLLKKGRINPTPKLEIEVETLSTATLQADKSIGLVSAQYAMNLAIEKATTAGSGWVAVCNSNHFGIAGFYTMMAAQKDMIGIAMTNASPLVSPTNSKERLLGTNPIAFTFPGGKYPPIVIDMATSAAANGKLEIASRKGLKIPTGWAHDKDGFSASNANAIKEGGSLLPLGGEAESGGHKGYALSAAVDILSGVLGGGGFGPWVPPFVDFLEPKHTEHGAGIGHFLGAIRVDAFRKKEHYFGAIEAWIERFKSSTPIDDDNPVLIPGEPETKMHQIRLKEGVPVISAVYEDLSEIATNLELDSIPYSKVITQ